MIRVFSKYGLFLTFLGVVFGTVPLSAQNNGLIPVATNVWSAPNRTLKMNGLKPARRNWKKNPAIPIKTPGFIPLQPAGNHNGPMSALRGRSLAVQGSLPNGAAKRPMLGTRLPNAAPATVQGPRSQPFSSLYRDPSP